MPAAKPAPLWAKVVVGIGAVLLLVSIGVGGYARAMLDKLDSSVPSSDLLGDGNGTADVAGPMDVLLIGSDKRSDWDSAQADTVMVAHFNADLSRAHLVSLPRDLDVPLTGTDCGIAECHGKLNAAFTRGGNSAKESVRSLADTIEGFSGVDFESAAMIDFGGFTDIVDLVGKVELCLPYDMEVRHSKRDDLPTGPHGRPIYPEGCRKYGKADVLPIMRERYSHDPEYNPDWKKGWGLGDYGRQQMQQHFVRQLMKQAQSQGYLSNPSKISTIVEKVGRQLLWDRGGHTVADYAVGMRGIDPADLTTLRVPSEPGVASDGSSGVVIPPQLETASASLWEALRSDTLQEWADRNPDWVNQTK